jgi:hypothetical protein
MEILFPEYPGSRQTMTRFQFKRWWIIDLNQGKVVNFEHTERPPPRSSALFRVAQCWPPHNPSHSAAPSSRARSPAMSTGPQ